MVKTGGPFPDIAALLAGGFSEETARSLLAQGEEVAIFVMLQLAALAMKPNAVNDGNQVDVNDIHPSEPSGSVATYLKPTRKKRLTRHREELFVFLYHEEVPFDNNHAERTIRGAVVMRKNSYCNRSAKTQAVLMSVFQTLKQRNANVTKTIVNALHHFLKTKKLPSLALSVKNSAE